MRNINASINKSVKLSAMYRWFSVRDLTVGFLLGYFVSNFISFNGNLSSTTTTATSITAPSSIITHTAPLSFDLSVIKVRRSETQATPLNPNKQLATFSRPASVAGTKIWVHDINECVWISKSLLSFGQWEFRVQDALMAIMGPTRDDGTPTLFVDVGANLGTYSIVFAAGGYRVEAFEPMEYNIEIFSKSIHENKLQDRIKLYKVAAGNEYRPRVCLEVHASSESKQNIGNNKISEDAVDNGYNCVQQIRLDSVVSRCPDLMKIDIEGLEVVALEGLGVTKTGECRPKGVSVEKNGNGPAATEVLKDLGYKCNYVSGSEFVCVWH